MINRMMSLFKKSVGLSLIGLMLLFFFYFHLYQYLNFHALQTEQADLQQWTANHYEAAVCLYILSYSLLIACAIPCATFLNVVGGFLFGVIATAYAIFSTTFGGIILFLAIRSAIGPYISAKSAGWIKKLERGFQKNAFRYLLTLRLIPILPCWVSNITAGVLNVPLKTFILATTLGITPSTLIAVLAGRGIDKLLLEHQEPLQQIMTSPSIMLPLLGLAILSIFPIIYQRFKKNAPSHMTHEQNEQGSASLDTVYDSKRHPS